MMKQKFRKRGTVSGMVLVLALVFSSFSAMNLQAQQKEVSGQVIDEQGMGLPGANIMQKGTKNGATADFDGNFNLKLRDGQDVLVISYLGFKTTEIVVGNQRTIKVTLQEDAESLNEVVVVGYGTQKKVNLTGAIDVATAEDLQNRPIANVGEGLQGVIPNLNVTVNSGDPTDAPTFNIRGFESINGGSPLILVDGVPMDLNRINPEDIETLTVLKDGAASAIYGARAAFGVILVTTKKGKKGLNVQLNTLLSWNQPIFNIDPIDDGYVYALERNKVATRDGGNPVYDAAYMEGLRLYWSDPVNNPEFEVVNGGFRNYGYPKLSETLMNSTSPRQKIDLTLSGASEKVNYYTSLGFFNNDGFWNHPGNDNFKRYNFLGKIDYKINDFISFDAQVTANFENSNKPAGVDINTLIRIEPIRPYIVPLLPGYEQYEGMSWSHAFPIYAQLENGGRQITLVQDMWFKGGVTLTPIEGLKIRSDFSYNAFNRQYERYRPFYQVVSQDLTDPAPITNLGDDDIDTYRDFNQYYVFNAYAEYEKTINEDHYFKFMAGFNQEWDYNSRIRASATGLTPGLFDIASATGIRTNDGGSSQATLRGGFYRINYIFKEKYLIESSVRYDGTSRFPKEDRFGLFPSISAGWRISKEGWMSGTNDWLSDLKIRGSYGQLGNQLLGNVSTPFYPYVPSLNIGTSNYVLNSGEIPAVFPPGLVSSTLTWETVVSKNLGLDINLFKNKLDMSFDVYTRETKDMLLGIGLPMAIGAAPPLQNGANLKTTGWEASVTWKDNIGDDFNFSLNVNVSDNTSEITKYENLTGNLNDYYVGQKIGEIWGYQTVGIFQSDDPAEIAAFNVRQSTLGETGWKTGDIEFADLNGDGVINNGTNRLDDRGDLIRIGNTTPRYSYGINANIKYNGFAIAALFQGVGKRDYYPGNQNWTWFFPWRSYNGDKSWLTDTWRPDNRDAYFPEAQLSAKNNISQTRFLQDASYIRLKSLNISYDIPQKITEKMGFSTIKIYAAGQNLWEYSNIRKPLDPEYVFDNSIDYPLLRTYSLGLSLNL
ncbi:SusC/RagA family TonB-linked outer membrane protein [Mariniflexile sp.]|uniref:SusC/RagA family TonB-linked outer membrane protein n=1 Tax=Mariniflexile sp. TaxID=1979402 RepID=UPI004048A993